MEPLCLQNLRSSSSGNCTAVWTPGSRILIDGGISARILKTYLAEYGGHLDALIITHGHRDHLTNPVLRYCIDRRVPVFMANAAVEGYFSALPAMRRTNGLVRHYRGEPFAVGPFAIKPFPLQHDAVGGCFGFNIFVNGKKISYATDFVRPPAGLSDLFLDSDAIVIESNHCPVMLETSRRPYFLKRRISEHAHMSNARCSEFLVRVLKESGHLPQSILLAHISTECNCRDHVMEWVTTALGRAGLPADAVGLTYRDRCSAVQRLE